MTRAWLAGAGLAACLARMPAAAQEDHQLWSSVTATKAVSDRIDGTLEAHLRFTDDASRLGQFLFRPSLTYRLDGGFSLTAGYVYARTDPEGPARSHEHRAWEQVGYRILGTERVTITGRTRLEQRFVDGTAGTGWRLRQQLRVAVPFRPLGRVQAVLWNETFLGLNKPGWGQPSGFDQTRTFLGVALPVNKQITAESGYMSQRVARIGPDRTNHNLAINFIGRF